MHDIKMDMVACVGTLLATASYANHQTPQLMAKHMVCKSAVRLQGDMGLLFEWRR